MLVDDIRKDFPILSNQLYGKNLIYLDNSATTQLPRCVLDCICEHYTNYNANVHRGGHWLSNQSTRAYEEVRESVRKFIHAEDVREIVFTSGTTGAVNMAAHMLERILKAGDEILVTDMEHHSNYLPWYELCRRSGAILKSVPVCPDGTLDLAVLRTMITEKTRMIAVTAVSNVTGVMNPVSEIAKAAHEAGAWILCDGAQAMRTYLKDVRRMDVDFFCFSGHKMLAPTGTGVLYVRKEIQTMLCPDLYGGGMIRTMENGKPIYEDAPLCFEAGTPNYVGAIGLGKAIGYLENLGLDEIVEQENQLMAQLTDGLQQMKGIHLLGNPEKRHGCISFEIEGVHAYDAAILLDSCGIAVRAGHHCAIPLHAALGVEESVRVSPAFYNTEEEIEQFLVSLNKCVKVVRATAKHSGA